MREVGAVSEDGTQDDFERESTHRRSPINSFDRGKVFHQRTAPNPCENHQSVCLQEHPVMKQIGETLASGVPSHFVTSRRIEEQGATSADRACGPDCGQHPATEHRPMGVVGQSHPEPDGGVSIVKVRTRTGVFWRPVSNVVVVLEREGYASCVGEEN